MKKIISIITIAALLFTTPSLRGVVEGNSEAISLRRGSAISTLAVRAAGNKPPQPTDWLYRDGEFNIVKLDELIREAAAEATREAGQQIEATLFGGMRYMQDGRRGDIDIAVMVPQVSLSQYHDYALIFIPVLEEKFNDYGFRFSSFSYNLSGVTRTASVNVIMPDGRESKIDIFVKPSWESHAEEMIESHYVRFIAELENEAELEDKLFLALLYYLGYWKSYKAIIPLVDEQAPLGDDYQPKKDFAGHLKALDATGDLDAMAIDSIARILQTPISEIKRQMDVMETAEPAPPPSEPTLSI